MNDSATQDGYVTFLCVDKDRPVFIANLNIVNGHYNSKADGISLPHGNYQVRVAITKKTGRQVPMPGRPDNKMQDELIVLSSEEYNGPKSPLKYEVVESSTYNIEVPAEKESHARAL